MSGALFYVDALPEVGELAVVDGDEGFHAANVRRIRVGEELDLGDGAGAMAHCVIEEVGKGRLSARVLSRWTVEPPSPPVTVVQALPKSDRSELAVELATEAGADAFVAWQAARCVARWDGGQGRQGAAAMARGGPVGRPPVSTPAHPDRHRGAVDRRAGDRGARRRRRRNDGAGAARIGHRTGDGTGLWRKRIR